MVDFVAPMARPGIFKQRLNWTMPRCVGCVFDAAISKDAIKVFLIRCSTQEILASTTIQKIELEKYGNTRAIEKYAFAIAKGLCDLAEYKELINEAATT